MSNQEKALKEHKTNLKKLVHELANLTFSQLDEHNIIVERIIFVSEQIGRLKEFLSKV